MERKDESFEEGQRRDPLENHPLRDTQEMEADIRRHASSDSSEKESAASDPSAAPAAVGGVGGAIAGAGLGTIVAGPLGTVIGALAGAVGGWWAGRAAADANETFTLDDDSYYRSHYETSAERLGDRGYDDIRPAYQLGHIARQNPDYSGRDFEEIEEDLQKGWSSDLRAKYGDWSRIRPYAREAYLSKRETLHDSALRDSAHDRTAQSAAERVQGRSASRLDGLRGDDTVGY